MLLVRVMNVVAQPLRSSFKVFHAIYPYQFRNSRWNLVIPFTILSIVSPIQRCVFPLTLTNYSIDCIHHVPYPNLFIILFLFDWFILSISIRMDLLIIIGQCPIAIIKLFSLNWFFHFLFLHFMTIIHEI